MSDWPRSFLHSTREVNLHKKFLCKREFQVKIKANASGAVILTFDYNSNSSASKVQVKRNQQYFDLSESENMYESASPSCT